MKYLLGFVVLLTAYTAIKSQAATVPCSKLHLSGFPMSMASCPNPFMEGIVDGQWIGAVLDFGGGNQGIDKVTVISIGAGANGYKTYYLGTIAYKDPFGWSGDMEVRFVHGKLWVINPDRDDSHQSHFGFTKALVRQYGLYGSELDVQKQVDVPVIEGGKGGYPSDATIAAALQRQ